MISTLFVRIALIEESEKGYTKLIVAIPKPFQTVFKTFFVWRKQLLHHEDTAYQVNDLCSLEYLHSKYNRLVFLELLDTNKYRYCPVCHVLDEISPESQDCGGCSVLVKRERPPTSLKLITNSSRQGEYQPVQVLTFADEEETLYFCWVYKGPNPYYMAVRNLDVKCCYNVDGWIKNKTRHGHYYIELNDVTTLC